MNAFQWARLGRIGAALAVVVGTLVVVAMVATSAEATTATQRGLPAIFVANYNSSTVTSYPLSASGDASPSVTDTSGSLNSPSGEAFDSAGDLWVANFASGQIDEFTPSQLASSGAPAPAVTISGSGVSSASDVAFDAFGDLWVTSYSGPVTEFTPSQIVASGSPTPTVTISGSADHAWGLAFDAAGDLWVSGYDHANAVYGYLPSQIAASGSPTPHVTLSGSFDSPVFPVFDRNGDLWVENYRTSGSWADTLVEFTPGQLVSSGTPTPAVTISGGGLDGPGGAAFDSAGDLWVPNWYDSTVTEYASSQLRASGSPTPIATISGAHTGLGAPDGLVIWEPPTVTAVLPHGGPGSGGYTVTVTGTGFTPMSVVNFGGTPVFSYQTTYVSPFELQAVVPRGSGTVDVTVSGYAGTSATTPADRFSYIGYWEVASDGGIFSFQAPFDGSMGGSPLNKPIVGIAADPLTGGYWEVASDGGIFSFHAPFYGSMGGSPLNKPIVGIAADPLTGGYWEVASDGGIFSFHAPFYGSMGGSPLNEPIVGIAEG